jgi:hypothetical protein
LLTSVEIILEAGQEELESNLYSIRFLQRLKLLLNQNTSFRNSLNSISDFKDEIHSSEIKKLVQIIDSGLPPAKAALQFAKNINSKILQQYLPQMALNPAQVSLKEIQDQEDRMVLETASTRAKRMEEWLLLVKGFWISVGVGTWLFAAWVVFSYVNSIFSIIHKNLNI